MGLMNARVVVAFFAVAVASTGCIFVSGSGGGTSRRSGDVTFTWSFAGNACNQVPDVKSVRLTFPGQTLENNGVYSCLVNAYPGIVLKNFAPGTYDYTIESIGYANEKIFTG